MHVLKFQLFLGNGACGRICHVLIGGGRHAGIARSIDGDGVGRDEDKHKSLVR